METRRSFLKGTAAVAGALSAATAATSTARGQDAGAADGGELFRISLAQWSLHRTLRAGELDPLDFAKTAKESFDVHAVEYVNSFFEDRATDFGYLRELKGRADDLGVRSLLIMIDGEGPLATPDDGARRAAIGNHFRWIAAAAFLGCHSIRVNAGGNDDWDDGMARAADSLRTLAEVADDYAIDVIVENHGGLSSNGEWLAAVMERAGHPRVGTLPDFGNFDLGGGKQYDRYEGVARLMPWARAVSAKSHEFDAAGDEVRTDYRRMLKVVKDAGYRGFVGIEYEGDRHPELEGIRLTRDLLLRVRDELSD